MGSATAADDANRANFYSFGQFKKDAKSGRLPDYSFIEPKYFSFFGEAHDQHPPHDIRAGETLIADVYNSVRNSPQDATRGLDQDLFMQTIDGGSQNGSLYRPGKAETRPA